MYSGDYERYAASGRVPFNYAKQPGATYPLVQRYAIDLPCRQAQRSAVRLARRATMFFGRGGVFRNNPGDKDYTAPISATLPNRRRRREAKRSRVAIKDIFPSNYGPFWSDPTRTIYAVTMSHVQLDAPTEKVMLLAKGAECERPVPILGLSLGSGSGQAASRHGATVNRTKDNCNCVTDQSFEECGAGVYDYRRIELGMALGERRLLSSLSTHDDLLRSPSRTGTPMAIKNVKHQVLPKHLRQGQRLLDQRDHGIPYNGF